MTTLGPLQTLCLRYIAEHPGCIAADVHRFRQPCRSGHRSTYAAIKRLVRLGLVQIPGVDSRGGRKALACTPRGAALASGVEL